MKILIQVKETGGMSRRGEAVEIGLPFAAGQAAPQTRWVVIDEKENPLLSQFKPLVHYKDGSIRAVHAIFLIDLEPGQERTLQVVPGKSSSGQTLIAEENGGFRVEAGGMNAVFNTRGELASLRKKPVSCLERRPRRDPGRGGPLRVVRRRMHRLRFAAALSRTLGQQNWRNGETPMTDTTARRAGASPAEPASRGTPACL